MRSMLVKQSIIILLHYTKHGINQRKMLACASGQALTRSIPDMHDDKHNPDQFTVIGVTQNNKPCRVIDKTRSVDRNLLEQLLQDLITNRQFGIQGFSSAGGQIKLDEPRFTHIQLGDDLFRLLIQRYEAHIEKF